MSRGTESDFWDFVTWSVHQDITSFLPFSVSFCVVKGNLIKRGPKYEKCHKDIYTLNHKIKQELTYIKSNKQHFKIRL